MSHHHPAAKLLRGHTTLAVLMAINLFVFFLQAVLPERVFENPLMCRPAEVTAAWHGLLAGAPVDGTFRIFSTVVTSSFLHADLSHIGFNLFYLWVFGYLIGELLGKRWVVAVYLLTAIGGTLCYVVFRPESTIPMLGASDAVSGFEGAYLGLAVRYALPDPHVWPMSRPVRPIALVILVFIGLYLDFSGAFDPTGSNTAFEAHLGGALTGFFLASFITPFPKGATRR